MKYTFQFANGDKQVLETRSHESQRHIVLKTLGYVLYAAQRPRIEVRVSEDKRDYRPDVVAFAPDGSIALWVDCGQISLRKLDDLTRQLEDAEIVVVKASGKEMESYARECARKVRRIERVRFFGFDADFVPALIARLGHVNTVAWQRQPGRLTVLFNGEEISTTLWTWEPVTGHAIPETDFEKKS